MSVCRVDPAHGDDRYSSGNCRTCALAYAKRTYDREKVAAYQQANRERETARSKAWMAANPDKVRAYNDDRYYKQKALFVESVIPSVLFERDSGVCHICSGKITGEWHKDHVIPVALGGPHCYANMAPAHPRCNRRKNARAESNDPQRWIEACDAFEAFHGRGFAA